jgi:hypothetical protein
MSGERHLNTPLKYARVSRLEKELLKDVTSRLTDEKETGTRRVMTDRRKKLQKNAMALQRKTNMRIRHPDNSLMEYKTAVEGINRAKMDYERMFTEQQEWLELDKVYKVANKTQTSNQIGLVQQAAENFKLSKQKLSAMTPIGV